MTDAPILDGRGRPREAPRVTSAVLDLLLTERGITLDRWVVLSALATESVPAELGRLVPALSAALGATGESVRFMLDEAESGRHVRVVTAPSGDPMAARVELTAEGEVLHERLRAEIDQLTAVEIAREARARLVLSDRELGVRFAR
jgi:hypothetical protein